MCARSLNVCNFLQGISTEVLTTEPCVQLLEKLFNDLFEKTEKTILISGAEEPLYLPINENNKLNRIFSTKDYFSSALHEISHWCVAGVKRRELVDYGYWYEPDGRSQEQQLLFEKVEVKPQALEWLFTEASGQKFGLSVDNVNQPEMKPSEDFKVRVYHQVQAYLEDGLPDRAQLFLTALLYHFKANSPHLNLNDFDLLSLG